MSDAFPNHLLHLSTLLLLSRSTPFTHAHSSSISTLSHLLQQYLETLASSSLQYANHSGRDKVSVWDLGNAIEDLQGRTSLNGLNDELEKADEGVEEEADGLRELAKNLQDHLATDVPQPPLAQLSYDPLNERDLNLLNALHNTTFVDLETEEEEASSPRSTSATSIEDDEPLEPASQQRKDVEETIAIKSEPTNTEIQDLFGDLDQVLARNDSDQFLQSIGIGTQEGGGGGAGSGAGVGDMTVSVFHPFDTAGRPISSIDIVQPESFNLNEFEQEQEYRPFSAWRDDSERPDYVPDWFPPFPGSEKESDQSIQMRRRREEKERERRAKEGATGAVIGKSRVSTALGGQGDPWADAVPFASSILAESTSIFPNSLPTPSSPHRQHLKLPNGSGGGGENGERSNKKRRTRRRSLSPPAAQPSSLPSFNTIAPLLPHPPTYLRPSNLRRSAASLISHDPHHPELQISSDSLFGVLPYVPTLRQPTLPPGFLPDFAPPLIHAFNTNLPWTVSSPVPYHPSTPTSQLSASSPHPRVPSSLSQISKNLSFPLQFDPKNRDQLHPNISLFSRLKRIGPPGPLGPKGETLNYEYVGQTALISMNVEWSQREHNQRLPKKFGGEEGGGVGTPGGTEGGGIKLKLGSSTSRGGGLGDSSRIGSPVNGFSSGATPGPSGLRRSESVVPQMNGFSTTPAPTLSGGAVGMDLDNLDFNQLGNPETDSFKLMMENLDSFPTTDSRRNSISQPIGQVEGTPISNQEQLHSAAGAGGVTGENQFEYPEWLLTGQAAPTPQQDAPTTATSGVERRMETEYVGATSVSATQEPEPSTAASLPSLPTLPSLPPPPPPPPPAPAPAPPPASNPPPVSMNMFDPSNLPPPPS